MGLMIAWKVCQVMSKHILKKQSRLNIKVQVKRVVAQVSETDRYVLYFGIGVDLKLYRDS
ncbi:uncharacterized protein G2W53_007616 [Senna tora]|uniref:Uncharacterized protein n=1 Tax=Senna tora TaxID=362788 RepID=A0A834X7K7_9FABA|nr:uncharacterized protein G2W53_007616 [Senna tora]